MGYDVESIQANSRPADLRVDPVLGCVYRVVTMVTGQKGQDQMVYSESLNVKGSGRGAQTAKEQIQALSDELIKVKKHEKNDALDAIKKARSIESCRRIEQTIKTIVATNEEKFGQSVLTSVESLLRSLPSISSSDVKESVYDNGSIHYAWSVSRCKAACRQKNLQDAFHLAHPE